MKSKIVSRYPRWNPRSYQEIQDVEIKPKIFPNIQEFKIFLRSWQNFQDVKRCYRYPKEVTEMRAAAVNILSDNHLYSHYFNSMTNCKDECPMNKLFVWRRFTIA